MHRVQYGDVLQASDRGTHRFENKLGGDLNSSFETEIDRAFAGEKAVHPARGSPVGLFGFQYQSHMDAADDEDIVLQFDLTHSLGYESLIRCIDLTRLQRASIGSGQSTGGGGDNIIQSRSVRF